MSEKNYTHKDLAALLGVSETTVKSYRRKFPGCIPVANHGKPIRFTPDAAKVATRIRDFFETGMSVAEVRARLSKEFAWISPEAPEEAENHTAAPPAAKRVSRASAPSGEVGPEISVGVSNMAKSMVNMAQQQKALLSRLDGIESLLEELGLKGDVDLAEVRSKSVAAAKAREELLENRLNRLDENTQALAATVQTLAEELGRYLLRGEAGAQARTADATLDEASPESGMQAEDKGGAEVFRIRPGVNGTQVERVTSENAGHMYPQPEAASTAAPPEPARHFFALPMVVRTEEGRYISAGGRGRGRFSINDLKALLSYGFMPPNHFTLHWETHGQGWWLLLEQEKTGRSIKLLLMELPTQKSGNVAEILKLQSDGTEMHPAEFGAILESLGE